MNILPLSMFLIPFLSITLHGMQQPLKKSHDRIIKVSSTFDDDDGPTCGDMIKTCGPCLAAGVAGKWFFPDNELLPCILSATTLLAAAYVNQKTTKPKTD